MRSGKFKSKRTIITGRSRTFFRILNTAEFVSNDPDTNSIEVVFGSGNGNKVTILPTFSCDIYATDEVRIDGDDVVEGIYEALPASDFKSGRFNIRGDIDLTTGVDIINGGGGASAIYRVYNTGENEIQLKQKNPSGGGVSPFGAPIPPGESIDFETPGNKTVFVNTLGDEGIYDFIAET